MREMDTVRVLLQRLSAQEQALTKENYALKREILAKFADEDDVQAVN